MTKNYRFSFSFYSNVCSLEAYKGSKAENLLAGLDTDTKAKAQELIEQAETQLAEYDTEHLLLHGLNKSAKAK